METWVRRGRVRRQVATASAGLLVALTGCTTQKPPAAALRCSGAAVVDVAGARTGLPAQAAPGLRTRPRSVTTLPGGPSLVLAAGGGAPGVYRVDSEGDLLAGRMENEGVTQRWRTPLGEAFRPESALVGLAAPAGDDGPLIASAHHQQGEARRSEFRLLSAKGKVLLSCTWRPYDRDEHVELSPDGSVLVATRTRKRPRMSGSSTVADRHVEIYSTATGERLARARTTDYAQDGARVYGRLGSEVFAHEAGSGREAWRTDTGARLGDPRKTVSDPVFLAGDRVVVQASTDHVVTALDAATGTKVWRGSLPGRVQSVHPLGKDRMLVHYRGGLAFTGPRGIERTQPVPAAPDGARQKLEHIVRADDGVMAAVLDQGDWSARALTVWGDTPALAEAALRIPLPAPHVQAVLTDTVAYVLPWVPDGEQASLYAYDLTAEGRLLWRLDVPDRLHIEDSSGPDSSLHPFTGGLFGLDRATGWVLHPAP
ncbi:PQQ-binding-like beta-propeller repeat protein [Streptomyces yerevanensis]|uniref:outer membrane protein assembly factor BamB family protein n=1 Tax=Streptomyces yerevanensis TaxID=66378 RepID=UPI000996DEEB|nr:PQQ-binding-like beta-propeller repeat protein [Streptomyces yerevanensis]